MIKIAACLLVAVAASGCPDVKTDPGEGQGQLPASDGPTVEFDPANSIIPFPNNLALDPMTGKVNLQPPACESPVAAALRTGVLNKLDGFGTFESAMQVTFTDPVDPQTLAANIVMYERQKGTTANDPSTAKLVPINVVATTTARFDPSDCANPALVNAATIVPLVPLDEKSTYTLAVLDGLQTADSKAFLPSVTWALVRQTVDPVTIDSMGNIVSNTTSITDPDQLRAIDNLWKAEATGLAFLDGTGISDRSRILVGWEVTTQTTTDPLDATVANSPASSLATGSFAQMTSQVNGATCPGASCGTLPGGGATNTFLVNSLVAAGIAPDVPTAQALCNSALSCSAIADVLGGVMTVNNYQTHTPNPLPDAVGGLPGAWSDPLNPTPQTGFATVVQPTPIPAGLIEVLAFVPAIPAPATGYPVVVFGHGLGSQKESLLLLAGALADRGIASIAIDFVNSGSRAIRTSSDPTIKCGPGFCHNNLSQSCYTDPPVGTTCSTGTGDFCEGAPTYATAPQCYAPFLSTDLAGTRDNMRQTILDLQRLVLAVKACSPTQASTNPCGTLAVDPTKLMYAGISLGGIIGSTVTSIQPDLVAGVLDVPGVGWLDILENSQTNEIKCPLVDALISAGVLQGAPWNGQDGANATGLCTTNTWQTQPAYQQFAQAARWILDPADGANFVSRLPASPKKFLIEEVVNDQVVPNVATDDEGALVGLMPGTGDVLTPLTMVSVQSPLFDPTAALSTAPTTNHWLRYPTIAAGDPNDPWGIAFQHASLLEPVSHAATGGVCATTPTVSCTDNTPCTGTGNVCVFAGDFGTARLQADAVFFLHSNE